MKTYAGDLFIELPGSWDDDSMHVYRQEASDMEVRVERYPVEPSATPEALLEPMTERLALVGPLEGLQRGEADVGGFRAATLSVSCQREGDDAATLLEVAVFKSNETEAITLTALAPAKERARLAALRDALLTRTRIVEVR